MYKLLFIVLLLASCSQIQINDFNDTATNSQNKPDTKLDEPTSTPTYINYK